MYIIEVFVWYVQIRYLIWDIYEYMMYRWDYGILSMNNAVTLSRGVTIFWKGEPFLIEIGIVRVIVT